MKRFFCTLIITLIGTACIFAQSPYAFKYQAVARDNAGNIIANQNVSFRISILKESVTGYAVYKETHNTVTNQFGLANLEIGNGNVVAGALANIPWSRGDYFIKVEMDESGGMNYQLMGISQLLSVPFSLASRSLILTDKNGNDYILGIDTLGNISTSVIYDWMCGDSLLDTRDGQLYSTVQIGTQCWMQENLNIGSLIDGSVNQSEQSPEVIEKYCFGNLETNCDTYGGLYQWNEVMQYVTSAGTQGICPPGWYLPTDDDWAALSFFLGGNPGAGGKLKEAGTAHWTTPNAGATNETGFTAMPGGYRHFSYATNGFVNLGNWGQFWSSTKYSATNSWNWNMTYDDDDLNQYQRYNEYGYSVRCLSDAYKLPPAKPSDPLPGDGTQNVDSDTQLSWTCSNPMGYSLLYNVYFVTGPNPTLVSVQQPDTYYFPGLLNYSSNYYWKVVAYNPHGDSAVSKTWSFNTGTSPCSGIPSFEWQGQTYTTVAKGEQCWMAENLNYGTQKLGSVAQSNNGYVEKYCYEDVVSNCITYGGLYRWNEMMDYQVTPGGQGICPPNWHIPTHNDWDEAIYNLGGESVAGGKMKEAGYAHWIAPNSGATNESGFTALPGGACNQGGFDTFIGSRGFFWTSFQTNLNTAQHRNMNYDATNVFFNDDSEKNTALSVRCLKD